MLTYGATFLVRSILYSLAGGNYAQFDGVFSAIHRKMDNRLLGAVFASYNASYFLVDYLLYLAPSRHCGQKMKKLLLLDLKTGNIWKGKSGFWSLAHQQRCATFASLVRPLVGSYCAMRSYTTMASVGFMFVLYFESNPDPSAASLALFTIDMTLNGLYTRRIYLNMYYSTLHFLTATFALYSGATVVTRVFTHKIGRFLSGKSSGQSVSGFEVQEIVQTQRTFRKVHSRLLADLITFDGHFASLFLFANILPVIVGDIYNGSLLVFGKLATTVDFVLVLSGIVFQSFKLLLLQYLPAVSEALYGSQQTLYRSQLKVRGQSWLREKIKLMYYYELMATEKEGRVTFSAGTYGKITKKWLLDVSFWVGFFLILSNFILFLQLLIFNIAYILYAFKLVIKQQKLSNAV